MLQSLPPLKDGSAQLHAPFTPAHATTATAAPTAAAPTSIDPVARQEEVASDKNYSSAKPSLSPSRKSEQFHFSSANGTVSTRFNFPAGCRTQAMLGKYAKYISPQPSFLVRISNIRALVVRMMPAELEPEFKDKVLAWLILCEQWPLRVAWILKFVSAVGPIASKCAPIDVATFYGKHVQPFVNEVHDHISGMKDIKWHPYKKDISQYISAMKCDVEKEVFNILIAESGITVYDIGSMNLDRSTRELLSYTMNLNPVSENAVNCMMMYMQERFFKAVASAVGSSSRASTFFENEKKSSDDDISATLPYGTYSRCLAQTVVQNLGAPAVIGMYSPVSEQNGMIVQSIKAHLQAEVLLDLLDHHPCLTTGAKEAGLTAMLKSPDANCRALNDLFEWLQCGGATSGANFEYGEDQLSSSAGATNAAYGFITLLLANTFRLCMHQIQHKDEWLRRGNFYTDLLSAFRNRCPCRSAGYKQEMDYVIVTLNSWHFRGCDNIWANIIEELKKGVEGHYGGFYAYSRLISVMVYLACCWTVLLIIAAVIVVMVVVFKVNISSVMVKVSASVTAVLAVPLVYMTMTQISGASQADSAVAAGNIAAKSSDKMGYMKAVKKEIDAIRDDCSKPKFPTILDSLPNFISKRLLKDLVTRTGKPRRCQLAIFVNDVDQLTPEQGVEVLGAIDLLTTDIGTAPFVVFLTIDPIVVSNMKDWKNGSILNRMVTLPFSVPILMEHEKQMIFNGIEALNMSRALIDVPHAFWTYQKSPKRHRSWEKAKVEGPPVLLSDDLLHAIGFLEPDYGEEVLVCKKYQISAGVHKWTVRIHSGLNTFKIGLAQKKTPGKSVQEEGLRVMYGFDFTNVKTRLRTEKQRRNNRNEYRRTVVERFIAGSEDCIDDVMSISGVPGVTTRHSMLLTADPTSTEADEGGAKENKSKTKNKKDNNFEPEPVWGAQDIDEEDDRVQLNITIDVQKGTIFLSFGANTESVLECRLFENQALPAAAAPPTDATAAGLSYSGSNKGAIYPTDSKLGNTGNGTAFEKNTCFLSAKGVTVIEPPRRNKNKHHNSNKNEHTLLDKESFFAALENDALIPILSIHKLGGHYELAGMDNDQNGAFLGDLQIM